MSIFNQTDTLVERDRGSRVFVTIASPFLALFIGYLFGATITSLLGLPSTFGHVAGPGIGVVLAVWLLSRSFITNGPVDAFVTVDPLVSITNSGNALVSYGPGMHFCYWWEQRERENNVSLVETAEIFSTVVQVPTGTITVAFSIRLRPDIRRLPEFLSGVASVSTEIGGIISAKIIPYMKSQLLTEAILNLDELNLYLRKEFSLGQEAHSEDSEFEKRFGVMIGDITAEEILPSKEVQRTMSAITMGEIIDTIVAKSFGFIDTESFNRAVSEKRIAQEDVNRRRTQTLAMSNNLHGMDAKEHTFNLQILGLNDANPALIEALTSALTSLRATTRSATERDQHE